MPTPTYTPLATVTLGSAAASVTFSSIPATYRDLILVTDTLASSNSLVLRLRFNADSGSNYSRVFMYGDGASAISGTSTDSAANLSNVFTSDRSITKVQIMDYSATDKHKTLLVRWDTARTGGFALAQATRWANTAAITSIEVLQDSGTISAASRIDLYGVIA
jgi:hypothetical protein